MQFWLKNLYLSKRYGGRTPLSEFADYGWKLESIDSLLKRIRKTGTIVRQTRRGRPRSARSSGGRVQSGQQAKMALISSRDFAWNCYSPFKCAQDNSPQSPAQMHQTMSCSGVVRSQSNLSFYALINNVIVCNKSCYCFILNLKLSTK